MDCIKNEPTIHRLIKNIKNEKEANTYSKLYKSNYIDYEVKVLETVLITIGNVDSL